MHDLSIGIMSHGILDRGIFFWIQWQFHSETGKIARTPTSDSKVKETFTVLSTCFLGLRSLGCGHIAKHLFKEEGGEVWDIERVVIRARRVVEQWVFQHDSPYMAE